MSLCPSVSLLSPLSHSLFCLLFLILSSVSSFSFSLLSPLSHSFFCLTFVSLSSVSSFSFSLLSPLCQSLFYLLCVFFCLCVCRLPLSPRPATTPSSRPPSCLPSLAIHLSVLSMHLVTVSLHVSVSVSQSVFDFLSASVPLSLCLSVYTPPSLSSCSLLSRPLPPPSFLLSVGVSNYEQLSV